MKPENLYSQIVQALQRRYQADSQTELDLQPDLERSGNWYRTEICDRLAADLRIAPSSIAKGIIDELGLSGAVLQSDSRGFIFIEGSALEHIELPVDRPPEEVFIYIQPPAGTLLPYSYLKLLADLFLQTEFLVALKIKAEILIPVEGKLINWEGTDGSEYVLPLFNRIRQASHRPELQDLANLAEFMSERKSRSALTLWLSSDSLSNPSVAGALYEIRSAVHRAGYFNLYPEKIERNADKDLSTEFIGKIAEHPAAICAYLSGVDHYLDLDWENYYSDNWLNTGHLLDSLLMRLKEGKSATIIKGTDKTLQTRIMFLSRSLPLMHFRAAYCGATASLLKGLRELAQACHRSINTGCYPELNLHNKSYGFIENLFSIIR